MQLGYALVDSPRLAEWKRFGARESAWRSPTATPDTLAFRTDDHARRLIVRKSPREDLALGWQIGGPNELDTILGRLAARGVKVEEIGGDEAALRGSSGSGASSGRRVMALELFLEPEVAANPEGSGQRLSSPASARHGPCRYHDPQARCDDRLLARDLRRQDLGLHRGPDRRRQSSVHVPEGQSAPSLDRRRCDPGSRWIRSTKIQHLEMQVPTLEDVGEAYRRCRASSFRIMMAVGQHPNDRDVSFYAMSPSGFYFELGWSSTGDEADGSAADDLPGRQPLGPQTSGPDARRQARADPQRRDLAVAHRILAVLNKNSLSEGNAL